MRPPPVLALILAFLLATPGEAGTRATYVGQDGKRLVVEVTDAGDARIGEEGASDYGVLTGGRFHVVGAGAGGRSVARIEDVADAIDAVVTPIFNGLLAGPPRASARLRIEARGPTEVAGVAGSRFAVSGLDRRDPAKVEEYVLSTDPRLAPVGAALEGFMNAAVLPGAALLGRPAADLVADTRAIFARGTPLAAGARIRLERIETADVPVARVALPAPPIDRDRLIEAMRAARVAPRD